MLVIITLILYLYPILTPCHVQFLMNEFGETRFYSAKEKQEASQRAYKTVEKFSDELVDAWNKQIDCFLTFVRPT